MKRRIYVGIAPALVGVLVLLVAGAPAPAQPPANEIHFRCYIVSQQTPQAAATITLEDQFRTEPETVTVGEPVNGLRADYEDGRRGDVRARGEEGHFVLYNAPGVATPRSVLVTDRFGTEVEWQVTTPKVHSRADGEDGRRSDVRRPRAAEPLLVLRGERTFGPASARRSKTSSTVPTTSA
jgi:hypothetical protein